VHGNRRLFILIPNTNINLEKLVAVLGFKVDERGLVCIDMKIRVYLIDLTAVLNNNR